MRFDIITIFPKLVEPYLQAALLKRAQAKGLAEFHIHDLRNFSDPKDKHRTVDDRPYGGAAGMLLKIEPFYKAVRTIVKENPMWFSNKVLKNVHLKTIRFSNTNTDKRKGKAQILMLDPKGKTFDKTMAKRFSQLDQIVLLCGRYEGFDRRIEKFVDGKISLGNFILSGGEIAALVITESTVRFLHGALGNKDSLSQPSFQQYTRPELFAPQKGIHWAVPKVLLSGDHQRIASWRMKMIKTIKTH